MIYYTIYLKQLSNDTGYIDVGLADDQLFKDFMTYLDIGMKAHKAYDVASPATPDGQAGKFLIDLSCIAAITTAPPVSHRGGARAPAARRG